MTSETVNGSVEEIESLIRRLNARSAWIKKNNLYPSEIVRETGEIDEAVDALEGVLRIIRVCQDTGILPR